MSQTKSSLILAQSSELAESFNLIAYYQDCMTLDSLFAEFEQAYEMLQAYYTVNKHRCKSYISTLLASCGISEEALASESTAKTESSTGSFLKYIWVRIKNIFLAMYTAIKTFFKRLFDVNIRHKKKITSLMNEFNLSATGRCKTEIGGLQVALVPLQEYYTIIDNLESLYSKIHRSGISGDPSDISPYMQQALSYFRINVKDGVVLSGISDLKPITVTTKRLDDPDGIWGWGSKGNILETINVGTKMLIEILTKAEALNIQSTGLENDCAAALRKIDQYSASGKVEDAIRTQDELYETQKRANFVISINKVYQAYVSQLAEIFKNAWINLNNFNLKTK